MLSILFFGDVVGRIGRRALAAALPEMKRKADADLVIVNAENAAHGNGLTATTYEELRAAGADVITLGDHAFDRDEVRRILADASSRVLRPGNFPPSLPGRGSQLIHVGSRQILIINLLGRVFMKMAYDDPFRAFDAVWEQHRRHTLSGVIVDFHAEATSEKQAFAWHVDGRATAVLGTHTHVGTADARILPAGTGLVCDVGMVGARDSVIGAIPRGSLQGFLEQTPARFDPVEAGPCIVNAIALTIDPSNGRLQNISRLDREITV